VEHFETEQVCKDGHLVHISITFSPTREPFGEVTGVSAILHDISERIQSAASIRRSRDELEAILRNVADGIAVQDATGRLVFANTAAARIAGYESVAEMLEDDRYGLFQRFTILDENGALVSSENLPGARALRDEADAEALLCFRTSATGEERWAKVRATVILEQQHVRLVINVFHDVTEERHAQEERAAANVLREMDRLKSEFIAHISHELRTPLHHVKGYAMTLLRHGPRLSPQDTQEALTIISDESDQLARLIDDLLNSSQIENGTLHLSFDTVYLDELVRSAIHRWQNVEGYTFKAICPAKVPPIPADRQRIQQVLDNLLTNVVRHTPLNTSTTVSIEVNRDHVVVSVSDQGPGVPEEHLPFLFDRFYQFPNSSGARRGSGLGLFISKGIIEQHGGRIWFEVSKGPGTTVRFRLPRRRMAALPT
jgi:PAS domain S-box-containing protein